MISKSLIYLAVIFQAIGIVWGLVFYFQNGRLGDFFQAPSWPVFLGFVLLLVAVFQSRPEIATKEKKEEKPTEPNKDNPYLP